MLARLYVTQPVSQPYLIHSTSEDEPPVAKRKENNRFNQTKSPQLRNLYPIAFRTVIKKIIPPMIGVFFIGIVLFLLNFDIGLGIPAEQIKAPIEKAILVIGAVLLIYSVAKFLYESLYRYTYSYGVNDGHFYVSKGVILKRRGSFPLTRITDVYVDRNIMDLVFGLYNLHISTPTTTSGQFARIEGLSKNTAQDLQEHLGRLMENLQQSPPETNHDHSSQSTQLRYLVNGN